MSSTIPIKPPSAPSSALSGQSSQISFEDKSNPDKLKYLIQQLRSNLGEEYDPVVKIAHLAELCINEKDYKTAINALDLVASRMYPKLKAMEVTDEREKVVFINTGSGNGSAGSAGDIEDASFVTE